MYDIVIFGKEILTLKGGIRTKEKLRDLAILRDGYVAIKDDKIAYVGERKVDAKKYIDAGNKTVIPSFIDSHTHLLFAGSREEEFEMRIEGLSYKEILERGGGIWNTVEHTKKATDEEILNLALERINFMIRHGTTVIEIKSGYGIDVGEELRQMKLINELKKRSKATVIPTLLAHLSKGRSFIEEFRELIRRIAKERLAEFVDAFCDIGALSYEETRILFEEAKKNGLKLKVHAGELADIGCGKLLEEFDLVSIDHLVHLDDRSLKQMIEKKVCGILLPATSLSLMINFANARKYINEGMIIALASDFSPASWICDMQSVIAIACRTLRMTQAECISASTINAAYALRIDEQYGSIEVGKKADLLIMNVPNYKWIGYTLGYNHVETVIKEGKIVDV